MLLVVFGCVNLETPPTPPKESTPSFALSSLAPDHGSASGGTSVSIHGSGFSDQSRVTVGTAACQQLEYLSASELLCVTPPGAGTAQLTVSEGAEQAALPFSYDPVDSEDSGETTEAPSLSCSLQNSHFETSDGQGVHVTVLVTVVGRTDGEGAGAGILGEIGVRKSGADPSSSLWNTMVYDSSVGDSDQYQQDLVTMGPGKWTVSAHFSVDGSEPVDCGEATLDVKKELEYCHIQYPCSASAALNVDGPTAYVWVYQAGVTEGAGQGAGIQVQLALEERSYADSFAMDPSIWPWFQELSYNSDKDGIKTGDLANDEYQGVLMGQSVAADYRYAARASGDEGVSWTYCDLGGNSCGGAGSSDGFSVFDAGVFTVQ